MMKFSRKYLILLALIPLTLYGAEKFLLNPAQDQDYVIKVNDGGVVKDLFRANASDNKIVIDGDIEVTGVATGLNAVGTVQMSMLSLVQFQAVMGTDWVLMNGQNVAGSAYNTLTGNTTVPDAQGRFIRMAGGAAAGLGVQQTQTTAKNGLSNSTSTVSGISGSNGTSSTSGAAELSGSHAHNVSGRSEFVGGSGNPVVSIARVGGSVSDITTNFASTTTTTNNGASTDHTHTVTGTAAAQAWSQSGTGTAAAQTISGDSETRPINIALNYFIKIN